MSESSTMMVRRVAKKNTLPLVLALMLGVAILGARPVPAQTTVIPTPEELAGMSEETKAAIKDDVMDAARAQPDTMSSQAMPETPDAPVLLARGKLKDADQIHKGSGTAGLYQLPDGNHLLRFEDMRVTNGPDLRVLLVEHPDPQGRDDIKEGFLDLGALKGNVGNQNYAVPSGTEVSRFSSVVIYCRAFHVLFSSAPLRATG